MLCFQSRADALRVQDALRKRLGKFGLTLEPTKTKLVEFGRFAQRHASKRGRKRPQTIYFLGFTLYCTRNQKGNFRADPGASRIPQSNATRPPCVLRHCRELSGTAASPSCRGALLAQDAKQPELERAGLVEAPADCGSRGRVTASGHPVPADDRRPYADLTADTD